MKNEKLRINRVENRADRKKANKGNEELRMKNCEKVKRKELRAQ